MKFCYSTNKISTFLTYDLVWIQSPTQEKGTNQHRPDQRTIIQEFRFRKRISFFPSFSFPGTWMFIGVSCSFFFQRPKVFSLSLGDTHIYVFSSVLVLSIYDNQLLKNVCICQVTVRVLFDTNVTTDTGLTKSMTYTGKSVTPCRIRFVGPVSPSIFVSSCVPPISMDHVCTSEKRKGFIFFFFFQFPQIRKREFRR